MEQNVTVGGTRAITSPVLDTSKMTILNTVKFNSVGRFMLHSICHCLKIINTSDVILFQKSAYNHHCPDL